jgi:hypothetical protein
MINTEFISFFIFIFSFLVILRNFLLVLGSFFQDEPKPIIYPPQTLILIGCSLSYIISYLNFFY